MLTAQLQPAPAGSSSALRHYNFHAVSSISRRPAANVCPRSTVADSELRASQESMDPIGHAASGSSGGHSLGSPHDEAIQPKEVDGLSEVLNHDDGGWEQGTGKRDKMKPSRWMFNQMKACHRTEKFQGDLGMNCIACTLRVV